MLSPALLPGVSGPFEILIVLFVILLLFGARRLPDLARSLGRSLSEFRKGREEGDETETTGAKPVEDSSGDDQGSDNVERSNEGDASGVEGRS